jgi:nicotinic acid mononucleotide adenylyltransferase/nicotinamide mononucleotide (NMN) deamidase PncC
MNDLLDFDGHIYVVATGAGAGIQNAIWQVPGCSKVLVGASFPYAQSETIDFLGFDPGGGWCSAGMAVQLATEAYRRACIDDKPAIGLAVTAAVATTRDLKGGSRFYVAVMTDKGCEVVKVEPAGDRNVQGIVSDNVALAMLRKAAGLPQEYSTLRGLTIVNAEETALNLLLARPYFRRDRTRAIKPDSKRKVLFPGAFNPLHEGHVGMANDAAKQMGMPVIFNIEVAPPHKAPLSAGAVMRRIRDLRGRRVLLTRGLPLYADKAKTFPRSFILIGADALGRMLDPKWGPSPFDVMEAFRKNQCRLLVAGRKMGDSFVTLADVAVPRSHTDMFVPLDGRRWDISSTEIRRASEPHQVSRPSTAEEIAACDNRVIRENTARTTT